MSQQCPSCNAACLSTTPDTCVIWSGGDMPAFDIKNGDYYNDVMFKFMTKFLELSEGVIDVSGFSSKSIQPGSDRLPLLEGVQYMADKLSNLSSDDIRLQGDYSALSSDLISNDAGKLINKFSTYFVESSESGSMIGFDLQPAITDMPQGYNVTKTNVTVSGTKKYGSNVVVDSSLYSFSAKVANDRFPLTADVLIRVSTPSGTVDLTKTLTIESPVVTQDTFKLDIKDRSKTTEGSVNLTELTTILSSQTRKNTSELDQYKNLNIYSTENIKLPSKDMAAVVSTLISKTDSLISKVRDLNKVNYINSDNTVSGTPNEVLSVVSNQIDQLVSAIASAEENIDLINSSLGAPVQLRSFTPCLTGNCK